LTMRQMRVRKLRLMQEPIPILLTLRLERTHLATTYSVYREVSDNVGTR